MHQIPGHNAKLFSTPCALDKFGEDELERESVCVYVCVCVQLLRLPE